MFVYTLSLMIGTAGLPHVIMRFFTVSSVKAARESAGWALVFIALLYTTAPAVAAMARLNLMTTIDQPNAEQNLAYAERPAWFKNWEKTGLLKFEDKNGASFSEMLGRHTPLSKSCEIDDAIASNNPAAVDNAAAKPPAATMAITQLGKPAISGLANTIISLSTLTISLVFSWQD
jgi:Na+(H+)/acetate symporter ActP